MPITGIKLRNSGVESNRSTNWATTTALAMSFVYESQWRQFCFLDVSWDGLLHLNRSELSCFFKIEDETNKETRFIRAVLVFKNGPTPASFCLFSFFSNTNFKKKTVGFRGIQTRIVGVEGKHADHLITTTVHPIRSFPFTIQI